MSPLSPEWFWKTEGMYDSAGKFCEHVMPMREACPCIMPPPAVANEQKAIVDVSGEKAFRELGLVNEI